MAEKRGQTLSKVPFTRDAFAGSPQELVMCAALLKVEADKAMWLGRGAYTYLASVPSAAGASERVPPGQQCNRRHAMRRAQQKQKQIKEYYDTLNLQKLSESRSGRWQHHTTK